METLDIETYSSKSIYAKRVLGMPRSSVREILSLNTNKSLISFGGGVPDDSCIPLETITNAFDSVMSKFGAASFRYGPSEGEQALREFVAEKWLKKFGIEASADEILIVNGSQQALDLIGKVFIDPASIVVVERPTYLAALQAFSVFEPAYFEVTMDHDGANPEHLERHCQSVMASFYYTVPTFQNPTGVCYSLQRRKEIANVLNRVKTMLVEDDPYGQLYYDARPGNPICSYGVEKSMLLGTFSKMIAPGFRLGWLWTKSEAMRHLITAKQGADLCSSRFMQLLLLETLKKLDLDLHLAKVRDVYRRKREAMDMLMHKHLDGLCTWEKPKGGMFFWTKFNRPDFTATQLLKLCVSHGVAFADGSSFFANSGGSSFFRLNFTQSCDEEKDIGLGRLAEVLTSV